MSEEKTNSNADTEKKKTAIFDYLMSHHSLLIGCATGTIAVLSFFVRVTLYISQKIILDEYCIPKEFLYNEGQGASFFVMVVAIGFFLLMMIIDLAIVDYLSSYYKMYALHGFGTIVYKEHTEDKKQEDSLTFLAESKKYIKKVTIRKIVMLSGLLMVCYLLFELSNGSINWFSPILGIVVISVMFFSAKRRAKTEAGIYKPREVDRIVRNLKESSNEEEKSEIERHFDKCLVNVFESFASRSKITNNRILASCITIGIAAIMSFVFLIASSLVEAKARQDYQVYHDNGNVYVVVYRNPEHIILEEAIIDNENLTILRKRQRYLTIEDIILDYMHFENVKKVDEIQADERIEETTIDLDSLKTVVADHANPVLGREEDEGERT